MKNDESIKIILREYKNNHLCEEEVITLLNSILGEKQYSYYPIYTYGNNSNNKIDPIFKYRKVTYKTDGDC